MAWQLRTLAVPAGGTGAAPSTHTRQCEGIEYPLLALERTAWEMQT